VEDGRGTIVLIANSDEKLWRLTGHPDSLSAEFETGWSEPEALTNLYQNTARVDGNPAIIRVATISVKPQIILAVPVAKGILVLTSDNQFGSWTSEYVELREKVDALTLVNGSFGGRRNLEVVYRTKWKVQHVWKEEGGRWRSPAQVRCGK
jgi:hypothetical protein